MVDSLAVVHSNGRVTWAPHALLRSHCELDLKMFPFDTQTCFLMFGSWTYDTSTVNVSLKANASGQHLFGSQAWTIQRQYARNFSWMYTEEMYPGVVYTLKLKRTSVFYQYLYILPTVVLAFLILLIHWVAPHSGERITLG